MAEFATDQYVAELHGGPRDGYRLTIPRPSQHMMFPYSCAPPRTGACYELQPDTHTGADGVLVLQYEFVGFR